MAKNNFQRYIIYLCLESFVKSHVFCDSVNCQFNIYLILRAGPTETRNQEPRPLSDLFQRHESNGSLRFGKRGFCLKITFFEVNSNISICVKF